MPDRSHRHPLRITLTAVAVLAAACAPAAPSGGAPGSPAAPAAGTAAATAAAQVGGTLTYGQNFPIQIADPHNQKGSADHAIFFNVYDRLVELDQNTLQPKPSLALSWRATNETTWELKLRTGVKFSDGTPFNAEAAKASLDRAMNSSSARAFTGNFAFVEAPSADTLIIKTKTPYAQTIFNLGVGQLSIIPPSAIKQGNDWLATRAIGSGPFLLTEWTANERYVLERNPSYWGDKPKLDKVVIRMLTNDNSRLAALQSGDVNVAVSPPAQSVKQLAADPKFDVLRSPIVSVWFVMYNLQDPVMKNLKFRQALNLAVDRKALNDQACEGLLRTTDAWLPPEALGGRETDPGVRITYDPERAKRLLAESGVSLATTTLSIVPQIPLCGEPVILAVQEDLRKVGVKSEIVKVDAVTSNDRYKKGEYQLGPQGWQALDPDSSLRRTWSDKGPWGYPHVGNPQFEAKVEQASAILDDTKRYALYKEIFKQMIEEAWFLPVFAMQSIVAQTKKLQGIRYHRILGAPLFGGASLAQ